MTTNIIDELEGLKDALIAATTELLPRAVTVRNRDWTGFYDGPWPLILVRYGTYRLERISGGIPLLVGQNAQNPNLYTIELEDAIPANSTGASEAVAGAQTDLLRITLAIADYFDHTPNRCLADSDGNARATRAGLPIVFRSIPPFASEQGGIRVVFQGVIGVVGIARKGTLT